MRHAEEYLYYCVESHCYTSTSAVAKFVVSLSIATAIMLHDYLHETRPCPFLSPAPGGKPAILAAHNTSATSVRVRWRALAPQELRGEFQAYRITYRRRNTTIGDIKELKITEESVQVRGSRLVKRRKMGAISAG